MLTGSRTTFKVRQIVPDVKGRMLSHGGLHARSRDHFGLRCLPGECVLQRAVLVRKKLSPAEGGGWLAGTLFCTHFRVAFVAQDSKKPDDNADPVLFGDHDVALSSVEKVVAVGPSRTKLVTPNTSLKFTPEELVLYCRDLRVLCFLFDRLTPETQAVEITYAIAKTYQPLKPGCILSFQNSALGSLAEMKQFLSNRRQDDSMNWFETAADWEKELERTRAMGWRVSAVNDRFEMATSLPKFNVVPQKVLDTELKKTFAHFNDGRIPRWCWHHPRGSDLLRMASFQNNIYHEKDDIKNLETIVFGVHQLCVVVDMAEEMPTPVDIQLAHTRLRTLCLGGKVAPVYHVKMVTNVPLLCDRCCLKKAAEVACLLRGGQLSVILQEPEDRDMNCVVSSLVQVMSDPYYRTMLGFQGLVQKEWVMAGHRFLSRTNYHRDSDKEEAPVFLLFLDCVWQLWAQSPSSFQFTGEYLLALHDSAHVPLFSTFLSNCQRERSRRTQRLPQSYTPVNGWSEGQPEDIFQHPSDPPFPPVWDWALQYSPHRWARFTQFVTQPVLATSPVLNGNLNTNLDYRKPNDVTPTSVFLFSRGGFSSPSHLLPWRSSGGVGSYSKRHRRAPSSETLPGLDHLLKACSLAEPYRAPSGPHDPQEPLLPLLLGPCVRVWKECYLRGPLHTQVALHLSSTSPPVAFVPTHHPVDQLAQEVKQLRDKLAVVSSARATSITKNQELRHSDANLNHHASNGTFLFSASRPAQFVPRATPPVCPLPKAPLPAHRDTGKRTFLFGSAPNGRADLRYTQTPGVRLAKNSSSSPGS
ncbi:myotubularin-related protein 11-like [Arapaima gigas]